MTMRAYLALTLMLAGCVEALPPAEQFLDRADVLQVADSDATAGSDLAAGFDAASDVAPDAAAQTDAGSDIGPDATADDSGTQDAPTQDSGESDSGVDTAPDTAEDSGPVLVDTADTVDAADTANTADTADTTDTTDTSDGGGSLDTADVSVGVDAAEPDAPQPDVESPDSQGSDLSSGDTDNGGPDDATAASSDSAEALDTADATVPDSQQPDVGLDGAGDSTGDAAADNGVAADGADVAATCPLGCDDANPCTDDTCEDGVCLHAPNTADCDDNDACTTTDLCADSMCAGVTATCQDGNACTADSCDADSGCVFAPLTGTSCEDGDACTLDNTCQAGLCVAATVVNCAATLPCHVDGACDSGTGLCSDPVAPNGDTCSDGNPCTVGDTCQGGSCTSGAAKACLTTDSCHEDGTCDGTTGTCSNPVKADGSNCTDGNPCTQNDACSAATCVGTPTLWSKIFGTADTDTMGPIVPLKDGGAILASNTAGATVTLTRLDAQGETVWTKPIGDVDSMLAAGLLTGTTVTFVGSSATGGWFVSISIIDGAKIHDSAHASGLNDIIATADGFAAVGSKNGQGWLVLLDATGTLVTEFIYAKVALDYLYLKRITPVPDGGWIVAGLSDADSGQSEFGFVARIDAAGAMLWYRSQQEGSGPSEVVGASMRADGSVNAVSRVLNWPDGGSGWNAVLHRYGADGNEQWARVVDKLHHNERVSSYVPLEDGFALGGYSQLNGDSPAHMYALRADEDGNLLWEKEFSQGPMQTFGSVVAAGTTGFWLGATQEQPDGAKNDLFVARIDPFGGTGCEASGACATQTLSGCSDGLGCTLDLCDATTGCSHAPAADGTACEDGEVCSVADVCADGTCSAGPVGQFSIAQGFDYYAEFRDVAVTSAGYAFAGRAHGTDNLWMMVTNASGVPLVSTDKQVVDLGGKEELFDVVPLGTQWAFVGSKDEASDPGNGLLYILEADGETKVSMQTYGGSGKDTLYSVAKRPGGLVSCGASNSPGTSDENDFWLVMTDLTGANATSAYFHEATTTWQDCYSVLVATNGDIVMAGHADQGGWVVRTDAAGAKLWDKRVAGTAGYTGFRTVVEYGGNLYAAGTLATGTGTADLWLVAFTAAGDVLWQKTYGAVDTDESGWGLTTTGDGFLLTGSTTGYGATDNDGFVVHTDLNGNEIWHQRLNKPANSTGSGTSEELRGVATVASGFVIAGADTTNGWKDGWIVKLDAWGHDSCSESGACGGLAAANCSDANPCTADSCDGPAGTCSHTDLDDGATCGDGKTCSAGICQ